ncbi:MAG: hypothetical protein PF501_14255 [Salinisphaera sp.]|jgi:hypothetical protein|nr:hypothetical protein [Salinisphaera sp.]
MIEIASWVPKDAAELCEQLYASMESNPNEYETQQDKISSVRPETPTI